MAKLPIGVQSFEKLIQGGYQYVDKTEYIDSLMQDGTVYFLSRPRRFGKSLFVSTLASYFEGKKELFSGLRISDLEYEKERPWEKYPVVYFSLSGGNFSKPDGLTNILSDVISSTAEKYGLSDETINGNDLPVNFRKLIRGLSEKTGKPVVVLVDEYDKPLLENIIDNPEIEKENRILFKSFFSVLKDMDEYLKFVFITGVTKFSKVSIFSDLNQLRDISLSPKYSAICGITEEEILSNFDSEIGKLAKLNDISREEAIKELAKMYDGYHFSKAGESVYNPFSILNAFMDSEFNRYWFETGTPTFLVKKLAQSKRPVQDFSDGITADESRISNYRAESDDLVPLFYQSGYLTIKSYNPKFRTYLLSYPNDEVKYGFLESLIPIVSPNYDVPDDAFSSERMTSYLETGDVESFMSMLRALLASIPYYEGKAPENEQSWRNVVYAVFTVLGQYVRTEVHSIRGRSDCIVETDSAIFIFEFKYNKSADEALGQIDERGYAVPFSASGKKILKIGANFSSDEGTLDEWKVQETLSD